MPKQDRSLVRVTYFVILICVLVGAMVVLWKVLPERAKLTPTPVVPTSTIPVVTDKAGLTKATCEAAKGHWVECGSPCHGQHADVCIEMCEPQCLCGGIAGWQCPANTICTDWEPGPQVPDALGVCRARPAEPVAPTSTPRVKPAGMICDETNSICVNEGYQNMLLSNPFMVTGTAAAFKNQFSWRLEDANGESLDSGLVYISSPDKDLFGLFTFRSFFANVPQTVSGTLVLYQVSVEDGTPMHQLYIPVRFPRKTRSVFIYWALPNEMDCSKTEKVSQRIVDTLVPIEAAITKLLATRSGADIPGSPLNLIPQRTELRSIIFTDGLLKLVFNSELEQGVAGSCLVTGIRSQIEQTAKQFPSVKKVEISVEGKTPEETLQP